MSFKDRTEDLKKVVNIAEELIRIYLEQSVKFANQNPDRQVIIDTRVISWGRILEDLNKTL